MDKTSARARKFREFAKNRNRLIAVPAASSEAPVDQDEEWLWEAQRLRAQELWKDRLKAIVTSHLLAVEYQDDRAVVSLEALSRSMWWQERSPSLMLRQCIADYKSKLALILKHARLLMFIDPYLRPTEQNDEDVLDLLLASGTNDEYPLIEIHRSKWLDDPGSGCGKQLTPLQWKEVVFKKWDDALRKARRRVEVILWSRLHPRFLVSDIVAIAVPDGFVLDGNTDSPKSTVWCRLGDGDRGRLQSEYDPAADGGHGCHGFAARFRLGLQGSV
jgi:hypothetical protein